MTMKIAVDLGNRYVKAVADSGEQVLFRSVIAQGPRRRVYALSNAPSSPEDVLQVRIYEGGTPRDIYVGKMAERFGTFPEYVFGKGRFASESAEILVWTAIGFLAHAGEPVDLVIDFPYSQFPQVQANFCARLKGVTKELELIEGEKKRLSVQSVQAYPQSLVAAYVLASEHPEFADEDGYIAVIDIGGDTTDAVVLEILGVEMLIHDELSATLPHGTRDLTGAIRRAFEAETGELLETDLADQILEHGSVYYEDRKWSFESTVSQASQALAQTIHSELADLWGQKRNRIRAVFWIGGGTNILGETLGGFHPHEVFVKDAQWVNVRGCMKAISAGSKASRSVNKKPLVESDVILDSPDSHISVPSENLKDKLQEPVYSTVEIENGINNSNTPVSYTSQKDKLEMQAQSISDRNIDLNNSNSHVNDTSHNNKLQEQVNSEIENDSHINNSNVHFSSKSHHEKLEVQSNSKSNIDLTILNGNVDVTSQKDKSKDQVARLKHNEIPMRFREGKSTW